ncbi:MAG: hypothetical protein ACK4Z5_05430 [Brevundimonas sp.]
MKPETIEAVLGQLDAVRAILAAELAAVAKADAALELPEAARFFDHVRGRLWPRLLKHQVTGCERLIAACGRGGLGVAKAAYVLATAYHETAYAMQPVKEKGGHAYLDKYDTGRLAAILGNTPEDDDDGQRYAGRGDVQLTGARNYARATEKLRDMGLIGAHESLITTPDLALRPDLSAAIIVAGMAEGWFTGKTLGDYLPFAKPATKTQFVSARRIVNGTDKAGEIAGYAMTFQDALTAGGWGRWA